jgi:hypothetical protein
MLKRIADISDYINVQLDLNVLYFLVTNIK